MARIYGDASREQIDNKNADLSICASSRSAWSGLMLAARRAGDKIASALMPSTPATSAKVIGSRVETSNTSHEDQISGRPS